MTDGYDFFELGEFSLQSGSILSAARLAYKIYGALNAAKDNVVLMPTYYSGTHEDLEFMIGSERALDPERYFIVIPNMFGNGISSSPSNSLAPQDGPRFPNITIYDNVIAQHRLMTEVLGVESIRLVTGASMGGLQSYQWATLFPDMVRAIAPVCGAARCSRHNFVFLEGVKAALTADAAWKEGEYCAQPQRGIKALARVFAGWGLSQAYYRNRLDEQLAFSSLEEFLVNFWEPEFLRRDANNLLAMLWTWQQADISDNSLFGGNFETALQAIRAKTILLPSATDLIFPVADNEYEARQMSGAECRPIPSINGHFACAPLDPSDGAFIDTALRELL